MGMAWSTGIIKINSGTLSQRPVQPVASNIYIATDVEETDVCYKDGIWNNISSQDVTIDKNYNVLYKGKYVFVPKEPDTPITISSGTTSWSIAINYMSVRFQETGSSVDNKTWALSTNPDVQQLGLDNIVAVSSKPTSTAANVYVTSGFYKAGTRLYIHYTPGNEKTLQAAINRIKNNPVTPGGIQLYCSNFTMINTEKPLEPYKNYTI